MSLNTVFHGVWERLRRRQPYPTKGREATSGSNKGRKGPPTLQENESSAENQKVEYNVSGDNGESNMNGNAEKGESSMDDVEYDANVDSMIVDDKCGEDVEVPPKAGDSDKKEGNTSRKSFIAAITYNLLKCDRNLECIPTEIDENGIEVVMFDDIMVAEGSKIWDLTLCGYIIGYKMSIKELRYNLRRMWSRYGFKDIVDCNNGIFFMKFHHEEGLNQVVNSGPWMESLWWFRKWSVDLNMDKSELDKIPLWVKLCNVPLEAWTIKGICALASRVGKPLVTDTMTTSMCKQGIGMVRYTRVLIEVSAKKELAETIEIVYKNNKGDVKYRKSVKVEYDLKPLKGNNGVHVSKEVNEGFMKVKNRKNIGIDNKNMNQVVNDKTSIKNTEKKISNDNGDKEEKSENSKKKWSVHKDILKDMKRSANKFIVFEMYDVNKQNELNELRNIEIVDDFLNKNVCLTKDDMKGWSIDMIAYYKQKSELLVDKGRKDVEEVECNEEDEDVLEEINGIAMSIEVNDVKGMDEGVLEEC
ncbi:zinc knuckle CX2CX4HX4C containing protein [Tanacetum coccineum]